MDALELAFAEKSLRQLCENESRATRDLGATVAGQLKRRLSDMRAANRVSDLVAGRPRAIAGEGEQRFAVELSDGFRIVFCANHNALPMLKSGSVNWSKVSRVKILGIERDHG